MANKFPSGDGVFGIPAAQTGILLDSLSWSYSDQEKIIPDIDGDPKVIFTYGEQIEISLAGFIAATTYTSPLSSVLTLATTPVDHLNGSVAGNALIRNVNCPHAAEEAQRIEITARQWPSITLS